MHFYSRYIVYMFFGFILRRISKPNYRTGSWVRKTLVLFYYSLNNMREVEIGSMTRWKSQFLLRGGAQFAL